MTNWTKVEEKTTDYGSGNLHDAMLSEDGEFMLTEDGEYIVSEGPITSFTEVENVTTVYTKVGDA